MTVGAVPRVSIIVTAYNIEQYIRECLTTIVNQTLRDIEIIVVDDGSSDATPVIIKEFAEADPRIVPVLLRENSIGGVATAANAGLDRATGTYVGFADGDDVYDVTMFEKLLDAATTHDTDLAMCNYLQLDAATGEVSTPADHDRWGQLDQDWYRLDVRQRKRFLQFVSVPWRKLYRRSMLDERGLRFPVGDYFYEDNPFHWFTLISANSLSVVPEALCHHRVARTGQTMNTADSRLFKMFEHHKTIYSWLRAEGLSDEYGPTLYNWALSQLEWISERTPAQLRTELFGVVRSVFAHYDDGVVQRASQEASKGERARVLSTAVRKGNYAGFQRILDRDTSSNPLIAAWYHLRHSGVRRTASVTRRYVSQRWGSRLPRRPEPAATSTDDVLFALMIIEQRLEAQRELIEQHAADIQGAKQQLDHVLHRQQVGTSQLRFAVEATPGLTADMIRAHQDLVHHRQRMPETGGWAVSASTLLWLLDHVAASAPLTIVECGSGSSTVWLATALRHHGRGGRVVAIESNGQFADQTRDELRRLDLLDHGSVIHAPLVEVDLPGREPQPWFDVSGVDLPTTIDLLFVDGPVGDTAPEARYPAFPILADRLPAGSVVVLDDTNRNEETRIGELWSIEEHHGKQLRVERDISRSTVFTVVEASAP